MPWRREWYDKISEALHLAKEDEALFEEARLKTEKHFDLRRALEIREISTRDR